MTTEEALKIATEIRAQRYDPRHYTTELAAQQACVALADALREAQARCVRLSETNHAMFDAVLPGKAMRDAKVGQVKWAVSEFERRIAEAQAATVQMREDAARVADQVAGSTSDPHIVRQIASVIRKLPVPAARLDAANLEIARLRGVLSAEPCRACHGTGRYDPYCWCCNESTHDHECPPSVACAHCRGTGKHFHAALTPKEPSDE